MFESFIQLNFKSYLRSVGVSRPCIVGGSRALTIDCIDDKWFSRINLVFISLHIFIALTSSQFTWLKLIIDDEIG